MYKIKHHVMLPMEVIFMDNKLLTQLRILKLTDSKPNFSELSRQYGVDRRTIKKYYDGYTGKPTHHDKPSKLDNYKELIRKKLSIKGTTLRSVYEFMISEVDSSIGSYSNFAKYTKAHKLYPKKRISGHPRFETPPGRQAQVDWKEDIKIANKYGEIYTFRCLIINWGILDTATLLTKLLKQDRMYSTAL